MTSSSTVVSLRQPHGVNDPPTAILRGGARRLLARAVEAEAEAVPATMKGVQLPDGRDRSVGTAMVGSVWFRPGSARSRCGGSSCSTAEPAPAMLVGALPNAKLKRETVA